MHAYFASFEPDVVLNALCLSYHSNTEAAVLFACLSVGFFPANQGFLKTFQIVLIGWISQPSKKATFVLIM